MDLGQADAENATDVMGIHLRRVAEARHGVWDPSLRSRDGGCAALFLLALQHTPRVHVELIATQEP